VAEELSQMQACQGADKRLLLVSGDECIQLGLLPARTQPMPRAYSVPQAPMAPHCSVKVDS
jgi:hypothetical protein